MPSFVHRELAWAWLIIVGGLMIIPGGIVCIVCGPLFSKVLGVITAVIGGMGFVLGRRGASSTPTR